MCPRRLAHEHASGSKLSPLGDEGFAVSNRIIEDAILWHTARVSDAGSEIAFPEPTDLSPEQVALYQACARGYLAGFPAVDAQVADLGWTTDDHEVGVRLIGQVGIALDHVDGMQELRVVRVARRGPLLDDAEIRFTLLRVRDWAKGMLQLVALDPLDLRSVEYEIDVAARVDDAHSWLAERVGVIRRRQHPRRTVAGGDCRDCVCIPGCPAITRTS
jgi:hypothetical protein